MMPRKWLIGTTGLLVAGAVVAALAYWQFLQWADTPAGADADVVINFSAGESLATLADELALKNFMPEVWRFVLLGRITGADTRLQAGEYLFEQDATPRQLLNKLTQGDVIRYAFRIDEGITVMQLLEQLRSQATLRQTLQAKDAHSLADELALSRASAEGLFFPDTYQYSRGHTDVQLLQRATAALEVQLSEVWQTRSERSVLVNEYDLLVLASIIEKETGRAEDREQISQVFHKRLADNMRLQTDPTVIYALGQDFDGDLIRAHLQVDSPYNTYRYRGLPPTPIATASRASLYAAAHPAPGDYVYFVAKGDGASQFSRTLDEHNKAVRKYQLGMTDQTMVMPGKFITLEGSEGAGKSTSLNTLCQHLTSAGIDVYQTREPGGTPMAEAIREVMLADWQESVSGLTELLLVFAARLQHLTHEIKPRLAKGQWVVCDRFTDATYAYQGVARGTPLQYVASLENWVQADLRPDLTLYLDLDPEIGRQRIAGREQDRMENEQAEFFRAVRAGYLQRVTTEPAMQLIDASQSIDEVHAAILAVVEPFMRQHLV